jgi:hypothetical protein
MKKCSKCSETKTLDEFYIRRYKNGKESRQHRCKACQKCWTQLATKRWRLTNPEASKQSDKKTKIKLKYGATTDTIHQLLEDQSNKCKICAEPIWFGAPDKRNVPHIDHCHKTGLIRGLLCLTCNTGIGMFGDSPDKLLLAVNYLLTTSHRERLSELAPAMDDAIVRSHENQNHERLAEMSNPATKQ